MKHQALFSSKDKSKKINVVCCKIFLALKGLRILIHVELRQITVVEVKFRAQLFKAWSD